MSSDNSEARKALDHLTARYNLEETMSAMQTKNAYQLEIKNLPVEEYASAIGAAKRLEFLKESGFELNYLSGRSSAFDRENYQGNIENYIGMTAVPTGVVGPLHVIGSEARGDFYVPLATSEGALVASYHRGAKATRLAGGISSVCYLEAVQRCPTFKFRDMVELGKFLTWTIPQMDTFRKIVGETSNHAQLIDLGANIEGNHLVLTFEYHTGDASGQNMVTICTDAICRYLIEQAPVKPIAWYIEGNYSGDKKATARSFTQVRGKKVSAEVELSREIVEKVLRTTPEAMAAYWQTSTLGVIQSGAFGAQGHVANGLCALFLATGQDAACVAEAAVGITRMEVSENGGLYASTTLPNLIVGTVGGGTGLPTQRECLELMNCYGKGNARKFAEIACALALAGELSIAAALSAGHFSSAHQKFGRNKG